MKPRHTFADELLERARGDGTPLVDNEAATTSGGPTTSGAESKLCTVVN